MGPWGKKQLFTLGTSYWQILYMQGRGEGKGAAGIQNSWNICPTEQVTDSSAAEASVSRTIYKIQDNRAKFWSLHLLTPCCQ